MTAWQTREPIPLEGHDALARYPRLMRELLYRRGLVSEQIAADFLVPDYDRYTHDPFLLKGMEAAVERVYRAVKGGEKVLIYSDYDADGGPGGVVLHDFFTKIGFANFSNYIPDRHVEGFGLNRGAVSKFGEEKVDLVITVDCGIADAEEVLHATGLGIDVIITDHHEPHGALPQAYAVIDPKQDGCSYPDKNICGAAVAFKLVQAFLNRYRGEFGVGAGWEKWLLDLVGIATLSDMVPLVGENRAFAYFGLKVLRKSSRPGLMKLFRKLNISQRDLAEDDIGFMLTPRLNAASRMGEAMDAFRLLATRDETEADHLSSHLDKVNSERKGTVASIVKELKRAVRERHHDARRVIALGNPKWRPSLLGPAAHALTEEFSCPVFLWGRDGAESLKGSCRSARGVNLLALMQAVSPGVFVEFGGHKMSGGFTVSPERVHYLEEELERAYDVLGHIDTENVDEKVRPESALSLDEVTWDLYGEITKLAPFGIANERPVFLFEKVTIERVRVFGKEKNHLELSLVRTPPISAIMFFANRNERFSAENFAQGSVIDLLATIERSSPGPRSWNNPELRLRIIDVLR